MRSFALALSAGTLCLTSVSEGATFIDFGTDPGQTNNTTPGFSVWGGWGSAGLTRAQTWAADSVNYSYTATGAWQSAGFQYRDSTGGTFFSGRDMTGIQPTDQLAFEARIILGNPAPNFSRYTITFLAVDGSSSTYQMIPTDRTNPTPFSYGTDPGTVPFTVANANTTMGFPSATHATNGGFNFATDVLSGIDIYYQVSTSGGTPTAPTSFVLELDNIQINPVPEPGSLGLLGAASAFFLRRRRA